MSWRLFWWGCGAAAAALGASLYVAAPGVATYWISFLLILPLGVAALGVLERRLPTRVQWAGAVLLALGGIAGYVLWPNADWWNFGQLATLSLVLLIIRRSTHEGSDAGLGGLGDEPWGPP